MSDMEDFYTVDAANEGLKVPLFLPDGSPSNHWLMVLGVDSDAFRDADERAKRELIRLNEIEDDEQRLIAFRDIKLRLQAVLVFDWSFDQKCTLDNVIAFFRKAPHLGATVDRIASNRAMYWKKKSISSSSSQQLSSDSASESTEQASQNGNTSKT